MAVEEEEEEEEEMGQEEGSSSGKDWKQQILKPEALDGPARHCPQTFFKRLANCHFLQTHLNVTFNQGCVIREFGLNSTRKYV
eukprot:1158530-Pelagomonas_calceolata.AAC.1